MPVRLHGRAGDAEPFSTSCVYVGPGSRFENAFRAGTPGPTLVGLPISPVEAVELFVATLRGPVGRAYAVAFAHVLRGADLVCTCPLGEPCHADVLLRLANDGDPIRTLENLEGPR
ncbi:DUF4326 domain-containing protein [Streptomyces albidoflavus]|uniref:DUF4326 domain-containing protein n=1 Tax=Streptomyces TaxID=1883 RepID=UPI00081EEF1F|nr:MULTISPECIES: DUF4326 domain-containing protein [Streptomyces]MYQ74009.1 DUF4326 domain-containing protein [Streptomyces sp. SID4934]QXQ25857.1 DUF4326 domain-containing protein [Streptomyces albidoflavus]QXQ31786.1 DUF4326 domain-containing protein [Streptomyces albidoflavus]SCE34879.1 protein of unknown function [Streptomyces sp. ScaeMP-6W]